MSASTPLSVAAIALAATLLAAPAALAAEAAPADAYMIPASVFAAPGQVVEAAFGAAAFIVMLPAKLISGPIETAAAPRDMSPEAAAQRRADWAAQFPRNPYR